MMIDYITNEKNHTYIYQENKVSIHAISNLSYVKQMCMNHLFTYEGYIKSVKRMFGYHYKIPIFLHEGLQLIATKSVRNYDNIWINYASVESIDYIGNRIRLTFTSHRILIIEISKQAFNEQIKRLEVIKLHISKHFHI